MAFTNTAMSAGGACTYGKTAMDIILFFPPSEGVGDTVQSTENGHSQKMYILIVTSALVVARHYLHTGIRAGKTAECQRMAGLYGPGIRANTHER